MLKLLNAYRAKPTLETAKKILAYGRKHPFANVLLTPEDSDLLTCALRVAHGLPAA